MKEKIKAICLVFLKVIYDFIVFIGGWLLAGLIWIGIVGAIGWVIGKFLALIL